MVHSWQRLKLPKEPSDRMGFLFYIGATTLVALFELFVILPYLYEVRTGLYWTHALLGFSLYVNVYISFYKLCTVDSSVRTCRRTDGSSTLPAVHRSGWFYCPTCTVNAPPRSYHCYVCDVCVLRRDHHCFFTGTCVGHTNQRHFLTLLLFTLIGALYATYLNSGFLVDTLGGISLKTVLTMCLPILSWMIGLSGPTTFAVTFVSSLCIVGVLGLSVLLLYHVRNLLAGQTCREYNMGVSDYDCGVRNNVETVFGSQWYVAWISSIIPSQPIGNGIEFRCKYEYENIKDN